MHNSASCPVTDDRVSRARYERERRARRDAEALLETKSRELYDANLRLRDHAAELERAVRERTADLERARAQAETANAAKSRFMSNISYQFRTPLHGVLGLAEALSGTPMTKDQLDMLSMISDSGGGLARILDELLDLTLIESGQVRLNPSPFRLDHLARQVCENHRPLAEARRLHLGLSVAGDLWCSADSRRIGQILNTLVTNAIKFTHVGRVDVEMTAQPDASGLTLQVRDTGQGIAPEMIEQIFCLYQESRLETMRLRGTGGMGLPIAREVCRRMGGDLTVSSRPGIGSTFTVRVPVAAVPVPPRIDLIDIEGQIAHLQAIRPLSVLVVEFGSAQHAAIRAMLASLGVRADLVQCGLEAVELIGSAGHDLILLNLQMPVMRGPQAVAAIRQIEAEACQPQRPIIGLDADDADMVDDLVDLRLIKPFSRQDLAVALVKVMGARQV